MVLLGNEVEEDRDKERDIRNEALVDLEDE
jgi:hypothetical protein